MTEDEEGRAAMQYVIDEMNAQWEAALTEYAPKVGSNRALEILAVRWIMIFRSEECDNLIAGLSSIGEVLDDLVRLGHKLPPQIQPIHHQWRVAVDMRRHPTQRQTPEGRKAAQEEALKAREEQKSLKREEATRQKKFREAMRAAFSNYDDWLNARADKLIPRNRPAEGR